MSDTEAIEMPALYGDNISVGCLVIYGMKRFYAGISAIFQVKTSNIQKKSAKKRRRVICEALP